MKEIIQSVNLINMRKALEINEQVLRCYLDTDGIARHLVKVWILGGGAVEELPPQQLAVQRQRGLALLYLD